MYVYALSYRNPYDAQQLFVLFLASSRLLDRDNAVATAIETMREDALGHEWIAAVEGGYLTGPLEIDGTLRKPSIAAVIE